MGGSKGVFSFKENAQLASFAEQVRNGTSRRRKYYQSHYPEF